MDSGGKTAALTLVSCWPDIQISDLPAPTITWTKSFKLTSFATYISLGSVSPENPNTIVFLNSSFFHSISECLPNEYIYILTFVSIFLLLLYWIGVGVYILLTNSKFCWCEEQESIVQGIQQHWHLSWQAKKSFTRSFQYEGLFESRVCSLPKYYVL